MVLTNTLLRIEGARVTEVKNPYPPELVRWARDTSHRGLRCTPTSRTARALNRSCGDSVTLCLGTDGSRISSVTFEADACAICLAATAAVCTTIEEGTLEEAGEHIQSMRNAVERGVGEGTWGPFTAINPHPSRHTCATLALEALEELLRGMPGDATSP